MNPLFILFLSHGIWNRERSQMMFAGHFNPWNFLLTPRTKTSARKRYQNQNIRPCFENLKSPENISARILIVNYIRAENVPVGRKWTVLKKLRMFSLCQHCRVNIFVRGDKKSLTPECPADIGSEWPRRSCCGMFDVCVLRLAQSENFDSVMLWLGLHVFLSDNIMTNNRCKAHLLLAWGGWRKGSIPSCFLGLGGGRWNGPVSQQVGGELLFEINMWNVFYGVFPENLVPSISEGWGANPSKYESRQKALIEI